MDSFQISQADGRYITAYGSTGVRIVGLLRESPVTVAVINLEPGGLLGAHPAASDQFLLVTAGGGQAQAGGQVCPLLPGTAVVWRAGEVHETRADSDGLTAVVIEGQDLAEALLLRSKSS